MKHIRNLIIRFRICRKQGHAWRYLMPGVTGDWIFCKRCQYIDEYIPGTHEPEGYFPISYGGGNRG